MDKRKAALLSNVTVDMIGQKLRNEFQIYIPEGFDTWIQEIVNPDSGLFLFQPETVFVLLDGTDARNWERETASEKINIWKQAVEALINKLPSVPMFISTIDIRENRIKAFAERKYRIELENEWYQFIQELAENRKNVYVFDLADQIADIGRRQFYSDKMWYLGSMPYSKEGIHTICKEIKYALEAVFGIRKKILVLDLDHTLWGGVVGEDGIHGIELSEHKEGERYYDFQRQLLEMKKRGVLLAINSKNNFADAQGVIDEHPAMLLRSKDFVSKKINWNDKASNIREMEIELNLTEGSFLFIDDNPVERELVGGECPKVKVPDFPEDSSLLRQFAEELYFKFLRPLRILGEDVRKTEMYQTEAKRRQEQKNALNLDDYIARLEIQLDIHPMRPNELERVAQLVNKTNQFNLTAKRYSRTEIEKLAKDDNYQIYVVYAKDKYGDSGLVSVLILLYREKQIDIDTFLMSCRVMGRKIENVLIDMIAVQSKRKAQRMRGFFRDTSKNVPVKELYDRLGFKCVKEQEGFKIYDLELDTYEVKKFDIFKDIKLEDKHGRIRSEV